jgi:hypothetical protein
MAALQPTPFSFPPIRYSPIQEAFRGALDVAMTNLFSQPFLKKAQEREIQTFGKEQAIREELELQFMPQRARAQVQSEIDTGQVIPQDQIGVSDDILKRAGVAPKYNVGGKGYYAPQDVARAKQWGLPLPKPMTDWITGLANRTGVKLETKDLTVGNFPQLSQELGVGIQAADLAERQKEYTLTKEQLELQGLMTPGEGVDNIMKSRNYMLQDPVTGKTTGHSRVLSAAEATLVSQIPKFQAALQMPPTQRSPGLTQWLKESLAKAQEIESHLGFTAQFGVDRATANEEVGKIANGKQSIAENQDLARLTANAVRLKMLFNPQTQMLVRGKPDLPLSGISAHEMAMMQSDRDLIEAMYALEKYPTKDLLDDAARNGLWIPISGRARRLLFEAYDRKAKGIGSRTEGSAFNQGGALDFSNTPKANVFGANSPEEASALAGATVPPYEVNPAVTGQVAPNIDFQGTDMQRAIYQTVYSKLKADTLAWPVVQSIAQTAFRGGTDSTLNYLRAVALDPNTGVSQAMRQAAIAHIDSIESLPKAKRDSAVTRLQLNFMSSAAAARESALNIPTSILPEKNKVTGGTEPGVPKGKETKKPEGKKPAAGAGHKERM